MVEDTIDELLQIAKIQGCSFDVDFKEKIVQRMSQPSEVKSIMYQDFEAKRPMEVETYLGSPIKLAQEVGIKVPRIETLYALLHHCNIVNQQRPAMPVSPNPGTGAAPPPRLSSTTPRPPMNGYGPPNGSMRGGRTPSVGGPPPGPPMGRGPPPTNGYPSRRSNGYNPRGPPPGQMTRRPSFEGNDLEDFSHLVMYDDVIPEGGIAGYAHDPHAPHSHPADLALREKEVELKARELQIREREIGIAQGMGPGPGPGPRMGRGGRRPPLSNRGGYDEEDDDDDDYFDPYAAQGPPMPQIDTDNFDMMSVTSRRNRKTASQSQLRKDPEHGGGGRASRNSHGVGGRFGMGGRNRSSAQMMNNMPGMHESVIDNPLMEYSSNRYGNVDRSQMTAESRTNSLTAARLNELQGAGLNDGMNGAYPSPAPRRSSHSPGNPLNPGGRPMGRPSPPGGPYNGLNGMPPPGGPSPPGMMRQPIPRYPPGRGNAVAPQQVEQHAGVSNLHPPKGPTQKVVRSLTGSASASAGSGESALIDSENSAQSSQSSLAPHRNAALPPPPAIRVG